MHRAITHPSSSLSNHNPLTILLPCCFSTNENAALERKDSRIIWKANQLKKKMDTHYANEDYDFTFKYLKINDIRSGDTLKELKSRDDNFKIVNNLAKYPKKIDFMLDKKINARIDNVNFSEAKAINDFIWDIIEEKNLSKKLMKSNSRKSTSDEIDQKIIYYKNSKSLLNVVDITEFDLTFCQIHKLSEKKPFKEERFFCQLKKMIDEKIKQNRLLMVFPKLFDIALIPELFDSLNFELNLDIFNVMINVKTEQIVVLVYLKKENKKEVSQYSFNPIQYENSVSCYYNDISSAEFIEENDVFKTDFNEDSFKGTQTLDDSLNIMTPYDKNEILANFLN